VEQQRETRRVTPQGVNRQQRAAPGEKSDFLLLEEAFARRRQQASIGKAPM